MYKANYLILLLILFSSQLMAKPVPLQIAPAGVNTDLSLSQAKSLVSIQQGQQKSIFVPAGHWLNLPDDIFSKTTVWQGQSLYAMRKLQSNELVCKQTRCQLPAIPFAQIYKFVNHNDEWVHLDIKLGKYHRHPEPFRRALKLPLLANKLTLAQDHELYYQLNDKQSISLYFEAAKKLKLSVRKPMSNLKQDSKVIAQINGQPASIINVTNNHAPEYKQHKVSTINTDYIAVPQGSYLKITAFGDTLIKLEQAHRGIYDLDAPEKQTESLFNPYFTQQLDAQFFEIYTQQNLSQISHYSSASASALEQRRYQDLVSTLSTRRFAQVNNRSIPINSKTMTQNVITGYREAANQLYPTSQQKTLTSHQLTDTLDIDVSQFQRIRNQLFLYIQAEQAGHLVVEFGKERQLIEFTAGKEFKRIVLPVSLNSDTFKLFSADKKTVNVAIEVDDLLALPKSPLLYLMQGTLENKSTILQSLLNQQYALQADAYLNSLPLPLRTQVNPKALGDDHKVLTQAMNFALTNPVKALPLLKQLVHSPIPSISLDAWRIRIDLLMQLDKASTANAYLESLLHSKKHLLSNFAARALLQRYQAANQIYKIQGLCALKYAQLTECKQLNNQILLAQQKGLMALWAMHDTFNNTQTAQINWLQNRLQSLIPISEPSSSAYEVHHFGTTSLQGDTAEYTAFELHPEKPMQIYTQKEMTLQIRVRAPFLHDGTQHQQWLHLDTNKSQYILPVFVDVASTAQVKKSERRLSIANEAIIKLNRGEQLTLSSKHLKYVSLKVIPEELAYANLLNSNAVPLLFEQNFANLVHNPELNLKTLLSNALYRLSYDLLNNFEFNLLYAKLLNTQLPAHLVNLKNRVDHYGTWEAAKQYLNYSGTQLVDMTAMTKQSLAEQLSRHTSQNDQLKGLLIRPNHTLNLDLSELLQYQIKLIFEYSAAELVKSRYANVLVQSESNNLLWTIESDTLNELALTQDDLKTGLVSLRWMNPYVSQLISVKVQVFQQGRWQDAKLDTRQLFYFAQQNEQIIAKLKTDTVVKIERLHDQHREEEIALYPAGKISIKAEQSQLARIFTWQLDPNRAKTRFAPPVAPLIVEKPNYFHIPDKKSFYEDIISTDENLTHVEGFMRYNRAGIFETEQSQSARHFADFGLKLRNKDQNHWYLLESFYTLDNQNYETFSINAQHNWLSDSSHWFSEARINNRWQNDSQISESHLISNLSFKVGEIWRDDTSHRHQWWMQPFYYYTSITAEEYIADRLMSPSMFSFYREDHMHGWRASYQYRYQPWVDNQLSAGISSTSNQDWTSLDSISFNVQAQQFYLGHIFTVAGASQYKFSDQHRPNNTWQYLTQMSWQTLFDFSEETAGWIKLSWTQDWFRKDHSLRLEVSLGNLQNTGFGPFAHDEILFESLQLTHLLEQDIYEQR
ncbi:hypothetical protein CWB72_19180 [Pseudoalteromonas phenolica]|nr:hypothetical protein CWB72_19180 [Pseudoalteromonas phenolica]